MNKRKINKILFVAPRYHTNQHYVMKSLKDNGYEVSLFVQYKGKIEDYSSICPETIEPMSIFKPIISMYRMINNNTQDIYGFERKYVIPNIFSYKNKIKLLSPDLVIIRERSLLCILTHVICKLLGIKTILYNQTPLYFKARRVNFCTFIIRKLVYRLTPKYRMTPVLGNVREAKDNNSFYVPFIIETDPIIKNRLYNRDIIKILSIGKFQKRKNLLLVLQVINELKAFYPLKLTIVGERTTKYNDKYYAEIIKYVIDNNMQKYVDIKENVQYSLIKEVYLANDVFVLPSSNETAAYSILEAMSYGMPVICSDSNGTQCYIKQGVNGYIFKSDSFMDLKEKLIAIIKDRKIVEKMGLNSLHIARTRHDFNIYIKGILDIVRKSANVI